MIGLGCTGLVHDGGATASSTRRVGEGHDWETVRKRPDFLKIAQFCFTSSSDVTILVRMNLSLFGRLAFIMGPSLLKALSNSSYRQKGGFG